MSESREMRTMRSMAWERAKGELYSVLHAYWDRESKPGDEYHDTEKVINKFIIDIESGGLAGN